MKKNWGIHFNLAYVQYVPSSHSLLRLSERKPEIEQYNQREFLTEAVTTGQILLETNEYRYIKKDDLFFPCIRWVERGNNVFRIKTVLKWEMVENRLQRAVDLYVS